MPSTDDSTAESETVAASITGERLEPAAPVVLASDATPQPDSTDADFLPLDPRLVSVERISNWIFFGFVAVGGFLGQAIFLAFSWPPGVLTGAIALAYVLLLVFLAWAGHCYPARAYRHAAWRLNEQGLEIRRGVWWRHEITIPRTRVQHTDVHQGPLMRKFGLARLMIHTAGTQDASIGLDGLSFETAQRLRGDLVADCFAKTAAQEER